MESKNYNLQSTIWNPITEYWVLSTDHCLLNPKIDKLRKCLINFLSVELSFDYLASML